MADDYYKILEVERNASQADIQKSYRKLARKYHPDLNPEDKTAKDKFQKVQAAFDVLNDPSKRELYDRYGSAFESAAAGGGAGPQGGRGWYTQSAPGGFEEIDLSQFFGERFGGGEGGGGGGFADLFGNFRRGGAGARGRRGRAAVRPAADLASEIEVPFQTAVQGGTVDVGVPREGGKVDRISVKIPAGIKEGAKIRLRGQGSAGDEGEPGDLLMTVHVAPHPYFQRRGNDLLVRLPVTLSEAVAGAKVDVPTPSGTISLRIPPRTSSGTRLRIRGHGVKAKNGAAGDLFAEVQIVLPPEIDDSTAEAIGRLDQEHPSNPRRELRW